MGIINLLKAGYNGKVGETYGVEKVGLYDIKAIPFSHTPHNQKQNDARVAFIRLNRIASAIAKEIWFSLKLSDKQMYKNNAVVQLLKDSLVNNEFYLENLSNCILEDGSMSFSDSLFYPDNFFFSYSVKNTPESENAKDEKIFIAIVTNNCVVKARASQSGLYCLCSGIFNYIDFAFFQILAFKVVPFGKKIKLKGLLVSDKIYVIIVNGIFYASRWHWHRRPYIENGIFYLTAEDATITDGILKLR